MQVTVCVVSLLELCGYVSQVWHRHTGMCHEFVFILCSLISTLYDGRVCSCSHSLERWNSECQPGISIAPILQYLQWANAVYDTCTISIRTVHCTWMVTRVSHGQGPEPGWFEWANIHENYRVKVVHVVATILC